MVAAAKKGDPIIGVVDRQAALTPDVKTPSAGNHVKGKGTSVAPEEHLLVVTLGAFAVASADAVDGEIKPGRRLSAGANGKLVKAKPIDLNGRAIFPAGQHAGYALGTLSAGSGKVGIFVNPH